MKKVAFLCLFATLVIISCTQKSKEPDTAAAIENTLLSVSFYSDSTVNDPHAIVQSFEKVKTSDL
jgi:outer membrane lipoprotein-sorting protein